MGESKNTALAFEKRMAPVAWRPPAASSVETTSRLDVAVVFTSPTPTIAALKRASALAHRLNAHISLLVPQVVPYPLPLESPPVLLDFSEPWLREIAAQSPVGTSLRIYLCRDRVETLQSMLPPRSLVVIGGRKRWWPTREKSLARKLRQGGLEVVFTETE